MSLHIELTFFNRFNILSQRNGQQSIQENLQEIEEQPGAQQHRSNPSQHQQSIEMKNLDPYNNFTLTQTACVTASIF